MRHKIKGIIMNMEQSKKNIVILGGGFGGVKCALVLEKLVRHKISGYNIILIDQNSYHLYTPALYEISSALKDDAKAVALKKAISIPYEEITKNKNIKFLQNKITAIENKKIIFEDGNALDYEYAVVALGSETNYFGIRGLEEKSLPLKTLNDAIRIRNRIEKIFSSPKFKKIKIVIGGGGLTGVELASELINYIKKLCKKYKRDRKTVKLTIIEAAPSILSSFPKSVQRLAAKRLNKMRVRIKTNNFITEVSEKNILTKEGEKIKFQILIWTGGVISCQVAKKCELETTEKGAVKIGEYLECQNNIFAIGDVSCAINPKTGKPVPWTIPQARHQANIAAKNIINDILNKPKTKYRPKNYPFIIPIRGKWAIAYLNWFIIIEGFWGWVLKQLVELRYLLGIVKPSLAFKIWLRGLRIFTKND